MKTKGIMGLVLLLLLLAPLAAVPAAKPEVKAITAATLKKMLGDPWVLVIDVRSPGSYAVSDKKIKGALREDPGQVSAWGKTLPQDKMIVLYCS